MPNPMSGRDAKAITRRTMLTGGATLAALAGLPAAAQQRPHPAPRRSALAYVGTYTAQAVHGAAGHGEGICLVRLDLATGVLEPVTTYRAPSPSWIALSPNRRFLYTSAAPSTAPSPPTASRPAAGS